MGRYDPYWVLRVMLPAPRNFLKRQASVSECPAPLATLRHLLGVLLPDSPPNHGVTVIYLYLPWFPVVGIRTRRRWFPNSCTANSETTLRKKLEQDPPLDAIEETLSRRHTRAESFPPKATFFFSRLSFSICTLYLKIQSLRPFSGFQPFLTPSSAPSLSLSESESAFVMVPSCSHTHTQSLPSLLIETATAVFLTSLLEVFSAALSSAEGKKRTSPTATCSTP